MLHPRITTLHIYTSLSLRNYKLPTKHLIAPLDETGRAVLIRQALSSSRTVAEHAIEFRASLQDTFVDDVFIS